MPKSIQPEYERRGTMVYELRSGKGRSKFICETTSIAQAEKVIALLQRHNHTGGRSAVDRRSAEADSIS